MRVNRATHLDMIDHVFLPRKIAANPENLLRTELTLLKALTKAVSSFGRNIFPYVVRELFTNMQKLHSDGGGNLNPKVLAEQLTNMKPGEMLGIYVRAQNCGLFIFMGENNELTLSTFCASLPNETIYGDHINGDIQVKYEKSYKYAIF